MHRLLADALSQTGDVKSVIGLAHVFSFSRPIDLGDSVEEKQLEEDEETAAGQEIPSRFLVNVAYSSETRSKITDVLRVSSSSDNLKQIYK